MCGQEAGHAVARERLVRKLTLVLSAKAVVVCLCAEDVFLFEVVSDCDTLIKLGFFCVLEREGSIHDFT